MKNNGNKKESQAYFGSKRWQNGEREAQDDIENGRIYRFDDIEDALAFLDAPVLTQTPQPNCCTEE